MEKLYRSTKIFVAGHQGMVGSAIVRKLQGTTGVEIFVANKNEIDLRNQAAVSDYFKSNSFDQVYLAAAKVGGIYANNIYPAEFIYDNVMIQANIVHAAHMANVQKLLFLGSSCIYPKMASQPISESALLTGKLEPTNEPYAIAKIAGIKLCEAYNRQYGRDYRSVMPTNLYGPNDNFHPKNSHVIPSLIRRFHEASQRQYSEVLVWGSGRPRREFLHVDDMASASIYIMNLEKNVINDNTELMESHINVGKGEDCSIRELAQLIAQITSFKGELKFDLNQPDGPQRKLLDISIIQKLGWKAKIDLVEGLYSTYKWYINNIAAVGKFNDL
jgi:GDP-L-fucose synthase